MRMKTILLASVAVATLALTVASADARSRHRTKQDIKEDAITRQLNLDQLAIAQGRAPQSEPVTNEDQSDMAPPDQNAPEGEQPANQPDQ